MGYSNAWIDGLSVFSDLADFSHFNISYCPTGWTHHGTITCIF